MSNLNTIFGGDASGIVAASKQAKSAVKDFTRTTDQAMSSLGDAFGVNTGKINQLTNAAKGFGLKLSESSNQGVAAFGKLLGSINAVQMGIAGLGLGAAVAGFRSLVSLADSFKDTVEGANMELQTTAYLSTYKQFIADVNADTARAIIGQQNSWKKFFGSIGPTVSHFLASGMAWQDPELGGTGLSDAVSTQYMQTLKEGNDLAKKAAAIQQDLNDLDMQRSMRAREWNKLLSQANSLKNEAIDKSKTQEERAAALRQAEELIRQVYTERYDIEDAIANKMDEMNSLTKSSAEQIKAANAQREKADGILGEMEQRLSKILSKEQSLTRQTRETNKELESYLDNIIKRTATVTQKGLDSWNGAGVGAIQGRATDNSGLQGFKNYGEEVTLAMRGLKDYSQEATATVVEGVSIMSDAIGGLIGDLATGGDAWKNFGNVALGSFADMMQSVGKLVMKEGIAVTAVWKSLTDPTKAPLAIAAGAALVAIGASIKAGLSNVASGSYSASSGVATGGYSSASSAGGYSGREMNIHVTGTLQASGSQLVAVLNNENRRTKSTT